MKRILWQCAVFSGLCLLGNPGNLFAGTITFTVLNAAGTQQCQKTSASPHLSLDISGACGANLTIDNKDAANKARVTAVDTGASDQLKLVTAKIRALNAISNYKLIFEREFNDAPIGPNGTEVWFWTSTRGTLTNVTGNTFQITGKVENPVGSVVTSSVNSFSSPTINFNWTEAKYPSSGNINGNRKLRVEITMTLAANSSIDHRFYPISLTSGGPPDPPCSPEEECVNPYITEEDIKGNKALSLLSEILRNSGKEACLGIDVPESGCIGVHIK